MNYSGAIAFVFQLTVSPLLFSHGHHLQNVPLSKAIVIIPLPPPFFFRTYLNSQEQLLKPCKGIISQELTSDIFLKIALINPIIGNLPVRIPPGVTGVEERLGRLAFAQQLSVIWVPGACVFSLLGNRTDGPLPSDSWPFPQHPSPGAGRRHALPERSVGLTKKEVPWRQAGAFVGSFLEFPTCRGCQCFSTSGIPSPRLHSHHGNLFGEGPPCTEEREMQRGREWCRLRGW